MPEADLSYELVMQQEIDSDKMTKILKDKIDRYVPKDKQT